MTIVIPQRYRCSQSWLSQHIVSLKVCLCHSSPRLVVQKICERVRVINERARLKPRLLCPSKVS
jgi:hypothetical protein